MKFTSITAALGLAALAAAAPATPSQNNQNDQNGNIQKGDNDSISNTQVTENNFFIILYSSDDYSSGRKYYDSPSYFRYPSGRSSMLCSPSSVADPV